SGTVHSPGFESTGDAAAVAGPARFGQCKAFDQLVELPPPLPLIGLEHVAPGPDLRDHDVLRRKGPLDRLDTLGLRHTGLRAVGCVIAQRAMRAREFSRILAFEKDGAAQT